MKLALIKLGARVSYGEKDTSGGSGEARMIIQILRKSGCQVDVYTKLSKKDTYPLDEELNFYNISESYENINNHDYDALIVVNGRVNYFGGAEDRDQILNYWLINNFNKKVFYFYCDPSLTLSQTWPSVAKKVWAKNWQEKDINITRKDIIYISQPYNLKEVKKVVDKGSIEISNILHFPFEKFPCLLEKLPMKKNPSLDLSYGGTMRGGKRAKKMVKFYFGYSDKINVEMFGKITAEDLEKVKLKNGSPREPIFSGTVPYAKFQEKMNDTLSHVVIGDEWYEGNDFAQRIYESIWASVVTFIDVDMDPQRKIYGHNEICNKLLYVKDRNDVEKIISLIKEKKGLRERIIEEQFNSINFIESDYVEELEKLLENNL